jgi:hypothetical protein
MREVIISVFASPESIFKIGFDRTEDMTEGISRMASLLPWDDSFCMRESEIEPPRIEVGDNVPSKPRMIVTAEVEKDFIVDGVLVYLTSKRWTSYEMS